MTIRRILIAIGFVTALVVAVLFTVTSVGGSVLEPIERVLRPAAAPAPDPPGLINYQGLLTDLGTGDPITGTLSIRFSIWDQAAAGNEEWNETQGAVTVTDGLLSVLLGSVTPITKGVFSATDRYLEIKVGTDPAMTPRQQFATVAYAFVALNANTADTAAGLSCAGCVDKADLAAGSVNGTTIADGQVFGVDLAFNSVNGSKIADGQVFGVDLAANSINSSKIQNGQVQSADLASDSVRSINIQDGQVTQFDLAADSVNSSKIIDGAVADADLANNYLRADTSDTFTGDVLAIGNDSDLVLAGSFGFNPGALFIYNNADAGLRLSNDGGNGDQFIYFFEDGFPTGESLSWNDTRDVFQFSDGLVMDGNLSIGESSSNDTDSLFFDQGAEALIWNNASSEFQLTHGITIEGSIRVDNVVSIGTASSIDDDFLFFDAGAEVFRWNETPDRFSLSNDLLILADLTVGGTKNAVVSTSQGARVTYAVESSGVWFEDFGSARLDAGSAVVEIEPLFAETVNTDIDYHVYLTPLGATSGLYVANKGTDSFEVRASDGADVAFDYRIIAKRLGYEDERLEPFGQSERAEPSDSDAGLDSAAAVDVVELDTDAAGDLAPQAGSPALADAAAEGAGGPLYALFIALPLAGAAFMLLAGLVGKKWLLKRRS